MTSNVVPYELVFLKAHILRQVLQEAEPLAFEPYGLDTKTFSLLVYVDTHPFPAALAKLLRIPKPTVTMLIKRLEERGFMTRESVVGDLRKFRLVLTSEGRHVMQEVKQRLNQSFEHRFSCLTPAEIDNLWSILTLIGKSYH
jgi:DNA-binding MarR family transcriptional regulator